MARYARIALFCFFFLYGMTLFPQTPLTTAEAGNFTATTRHADVWQFIRELQRRTPLLRVEKLCITAEGREVPLLILGNPVSSSPEALKRDKRGVIYIQANIHAGEIEGKEASLMLARDIVLAEKIPYLDKLIILIAPNLNADGNERISPKNRSHQPGPEQGVGIRANSQNLDLNRDAMKLESQELAAVVANVFCRWDPLVFVDCHTTNGSYHQEVVTYSWGLNPNGDQGIINYLSGKMIPEIDRILEKKYNTLSCGYGGFRDPRAPEKGWQTLEPQPRYVTNYFGLRNRLAILDENYVYADYRARVMGNYHFLRAILDYCYTHLDEITRLTTEADERSIRKGLNPSESDVFAVEYDLRPLKDPLTVHAYEVELIPAAEGRRPRYKRTDKVNVHTVPYYSDFFAKRTARFPHAYLLNVPAPEVVRKLLRHGILVERLTEPTTLEVELFKIKEMKAAERLYQGHRMNTVKGEFTVEKKEFPAGAHFITTAQPLGNLAAYLLEPESDDGLLVWNYLDKFVVSQWGMGFESYPVCKLLKPVNLAKETVTE